MAESKESTALLPSSDSIQGARRSKDASYHGTTPGEAFFNLLKGYFGAGMLRLVEQLRIEQLSHNILVFLGH